MRSLRVVPLLMSPECPRRVLLIWEVEKPTCQMLCCHQLPGHDIVVKPFAAVSPSARPLTSSAAQLGPASTLVPPTSVLSARPDCKGSENPFTYFLPPFSPVLCLVDALTYLHPTYWFDGIFSLAWSWRWSFSREKPHPILGQLLTFGQEG